MNRKQVLYITGASGFLGAGLMQKAGEEYHVCPVSRSAAGQAGDIPHFEHGSSVVHLAGRAHILKETASDPVAEFTRGNVDYTVSVAQKALECKVSKYIYLSSLSVFGRFRGGIIPDDAPPRPDDPYGESKYSAERELQSLFANQETRCIILRLPMVYGPGNKGNMLPLLKMASKKIPLPLKGAHGKRSFLYSGNFHDAVMRILADRNSLPPSVRTYFLTDNQDMTSRELFSLLSESFYGKSGVYYFPKPVLDVGAKMGDLLGVCGVSVPLNTNTMIRLFEEYRISPGKFMNDYSWKPPFTPREGIARTVEWYKRQTGRSNNSIPRV